MKRLFTLSFFLLFATSLAIAQLNWEHTNGPKGGTLSRLYSNGAYAFFADEYFLYRTANGMQWEKLPEADIWPMATNGSKLAAQVLANHFNGLYDRSFKISQDNGETWTTATLPPGNNYFNDIAWCSHGIYIPDEQFDNLYHSADEGQTWETTVLPFQFGLLELFVFEDRLYVPNSNLIWRTDTNGENWASISVPIASNESIVTVFVQGQNLVAATNNSIWYSNNDGQSWINQAKPWAEGFDHFVKVGTQLYISGGSGNLARSSDYGASWQLLFEDDTYSYKFYFLSSIAGQVLGSTYTKGVFRWDETTQTIVEANEGLCSAAVQGLTAGGDKIWASTWNGLYDFDLLQNDWSANSHLPIPEDYYEYIYANDNGLVVTNEWLSNLYISTDYGQTWDTVNPFVNTSFGLGLIADIKLFGDVIFVLDDVSSEMLRSADAGQTWQTIFYDFCCGNILEFNGQLLVREGLTIKSSTDLGATWQYFGDYPFNSYDWYSAGDRLFAPVSGLSSIRLYTSTDGINWSDTHDGFPETAHFISDPFGPSSIRFFKHGDKYFAFEPSAGIFASVDSCQTWLPLERHRSWSSVTLGQDDNFYAGGFGGGVLKTAVPQNLLGELVSGKVYSDENNNGAYDTNEPLFPNIPVGIWQPDQWYSFYSTTTKADGSYVLGITPNLQDTLRPIIQSDYVEAINPPFYVANAGGAGKDFGVKLTPNITDLSINGQYHFRPRPGFDLRIQGRFHNDGSNHPAATASLRLGADLIFLNATPPPTAIFGDSLVWDLGELQVFSGGVIQVETNLPATVPLGTLLESRWHISSPMADETPDNNRYILQDTVVGSFDPNDKRVTPAEGLTAAEIAGGTEIFYTVNFQNTGTFPAERVRITDMLDTALYLPSLRLVAASHDVTGFQLRPGGLLEILFDNIQLPDSLSDEPGSHGFVTFAIQRKKAFDPDFPVRNFAAIYFDFNEPIFTNEVAFKIRQEQAVGIRDIRQQRDNGLHIYPNPAGTHLTVFSDGKLQGPGWLTFQNTVGQVCRRVQVADVAAPIFVQTDGLTDGVYFVQLTNEHGALAGRVVFQ